MANITILGLGAMGSRMAVRLLSAGHRVTVWNRTPAAAESLGTAGAIIAETPRGAVANADVVLSMLRDDEASRDVWLGDDSGALAGMPSDAIAVESSTLTPDWIKSLSEKMADNRQAFVEAPVSGSRPQAEAGTLIFFAAGEEDVIKKIRPVLMQMGSVIHHTGTHGSAALTKLATNALMGVQVTAIAEIIGVLSREGADISRVLHAVAGTSSWSALAGGISGMMLNENYHPQFPAELLEKDFGYILQSADHPGKQAPTLAAARAVFRRALEEGLGADNMSGVVRLFK